MAFLAWSVCYSVCVVGASYTLGKMNKKKK